MFHSLWRKKSFVFTLFIGSHLLSVRLMKKNDPSLLKRIIEREKSCFCEVFNFSPRSCFFFFSFSSSYINKVTEADCMPAYLPRSYVASLKLSRLFVFLHQKISSQEADWFNIGSVFHYYRTLIQCLFLTFPFSLFPFFLFISQLQVIELIHDLLTKQIDLKAWNTFYYYVTIQSIENNSDNNINNNSKFNLGILLAKIKTMNI